MKRMALLAVTLTIAVLVLAPLATADVPPVMNYQGYLTDENGDPVPDADYALTFRIYNVEGGGTHLWEEIHPAVPVADGFFSVILGDGTPPVPIGDDVFNQPDRWLGIKVGADDELSPRTQLVTVPYAFRISTIDGATGGEITGYIHASGSIKSGSSVIIRGTPDHFQNEIEATDPPELNMIADEVNFAGKVTIGPGHTNTGTNAFVAGANNAVTGDYCTVSGGQNNMAVDLAASVGGGEDNWAMQEYITIAGGAGNNANARFSTIAGGVLNVTDGDTSTIGGGHHNKASGPISTIGGGDYNTASGRWSTVGGGAWNTASGPLSTVCGGKNDTASGDYSTIAGGVGIIASGYASTVGGGYQNYAAGSYSTVGGGLLDTTKAHYGGVFSGYDNLAGDEEDDTAVFVGGGWENQAIAPYATVGGGYSNVAGYYANTISGGYGNATTNAYSTVGGGRTNSAFGPYSTVGGGLTNSTQGDYSVISGGNLNTLTNSADYSMAFGYNVWVNNAYRIVFFDGSNDGRFGLNRDDNNGGINHPIHVGTDATNGNGAHLTAGGTWTNGSSREFKENFQQIDGKDVLDRIDGLPIKSWEYKGTDERHIWPCAEDFHEAFDIGVIKEDGTRDNKYLAAGDVAGVALVGVKELAKQNQELRERIVQLEALVEMLLVQQDGFNEPKTEFGMNK